MTDVIEVLRANMPTVEPPSEAVVAAARREFLKTALRASNLPRPERWWVRAGTAAVAAAVVLTIIGVVNFKDGEPGGASAQAVELLDSSARAAESAPQPSPGEYLYVTIRQGVGAHAEEIETWLPGLSTDPIYRRISAPSAPTSVTKFGADAVPRIYLDGPRSSPSLLTAMVRLVYPKRATVSKVSPTAMWNAAAVVLQDPLAPAGFKASVLRALRQVDGVRVVKPSAPVNGIHAEMLGLKNSPLLVVFEARDYTFLGVRRLVSVSSTQQESLTTVRTKITQSLPKFAQRVEEQRAQQDEVRSQLLDLGAR